MGNHLTSIPTFQMPTCSPNSCPGWPPVPDRYLPLYHPVAGRYPVEPPLNHRERASHRRLGAVVAGIWYDPPGPFAAQVLEIALLWVHTKLTRPWCQREFYWVEIYAVSHYFLVFSSPQCGRIREFLDGVYSDLSGHWCWRCVDF